MKHVSILLAAMCLACCPLVFAQDTPASTTSEPEPVEGKPHDKQIDQTNLGKQFGPIDILSDTKGVDIHSYLNEMLPKIKTNWYKRIPDSARPPMRKKGKVSIGFRVMKDGEITDTRYVARSGDLALDQAAYSGVSDSSPLPPLPSNFTCQFLALRFIFYYNPDKLDDADRRHDSQLVPCVTTTTHLIGEIGITVSPSSVQVTAGAKQQFLAIITKSTDSAVTWSIGGPGCEASTCGVISADGLYTAPLEIPRLEAITVTATLATSPTQTASATVTIAQSSTPH